MLMLSFLFVSGTAEAQSAMSPEEQDVICPLVSEMAMVAAGFRNDTEAGFHFSACLLNFYQNTSTLMQRLPALVEVAEGCQQDNAATEARLKCILNRFQQG